MSTRILGLLILCCSASADAQPAEPGLYLHIVPTANRTTTFPGIDKPAFLELHDVDSGKLSAMLEGSTVRLVDSGDRLLTIAVTGSETIRGGVLPIHSESTFVIDYAEPAVQARLTELLDEYGEQPGTAEVTQFVYDAIADKSYGHAFDLASQVAERAAGDCTEHAVLLAALLRATGHPARIVFGIMLVDNGSSFHAFGHAWTETRDGESWRILDATMPAAEMPGANVRYLPFNALNNEGPGYFMDMAMLAANLPGRIDLVPALIAD